MTGRPIALTGATGFVGGHVLTALKDRGARIRVLARDRVAAERLGDVEIVEGGLEDDAALERLVAGAETVIHCAGLVSARSAREFHNINAAATGRLAGLAAAASVRHFILVSSLAARAPEISDYAASKYHGEQALRAAAGAMTCTILRPPAIYGPGDKGTLPLVRALSQRIAFVPGRRDGRASLIYVADLAEAVIALLGEDAPAGLIHELHDGKADGYSWGELALASGAALGRRVDCLYVPHVVASGVGAAAHMFSRLTGRAGLVNPGKMRELYHRDWVCRNGLLDECSPWRPKVGFEQGFREAVAWYRSHGWL